MKARTLLVILLSLVCGLSAAAGVRIMRGSTTVDATSIDTNPVLVASVNIARGVTVTEQHVTVRQWPADMVPPGACTTIEDVKERAALSLIVQGEPLLDAKLASQDSGRGMAPLIPAGMRAFTIHTPTRASGVAGFVLPGNKVDILLTMSRSRGDGTGGGSTTTLLQNVEILAVDQQLNAPAENKVDANRLRSVTVLVTPSQAAKLSLAQTKGTLHLSLRNDGDQAPAQTRPVTLNEIRFSEEHGHHTPGSTCAVAGDESQSTAPAKRLQIRTLRGRVDGVVTVQESTL